MKSGGGIIVLAAIVAAPVSVGDAQPQDLPPAVRAWHAQAVQDCRAIGGRLSVGPGYVSRADFNRDGMPDYILDNSKLGCSASASMFCGSHGCSRDIYVSRGNAFYPVAGIVVDSAKVVTRAGKTLLHVNENDGAGGKYWGWNGSKIDLIRPSSSASASPAAPVASRPSPMPAGAGAGVSTWQAIAFERMQKVEIARRYPFVRAANHDYNLDYESGETDGWVNYPGTSHVAAFEMKGVNYLIVSPQEAACGSDCYAQVFADSGRGYKMIHRAPGLRPMFRRTEAAAIKIGMCSPARASAGKGPYAIWTMRDGVLGRPAPSGQYGYFALSGDQSIPNGPSRCVRN
jgi:hypothetical protein